MNAMMWQSSHSGPLRLSPDSSRLENDDILTGYAELPLRCFTFPHRHRLLLSFQWYSYVLLYLGKLIEDQMLNKPRMFSL